MNEIVMNATDIKDPVYHKVGDYFTTRGKIGVEHAFSENNYMELGLFDSIGFAKMVVDLEEMFDIFFSKDEMQNPLFQTFNGLISIINQKINRE